MGVLFLHFLLLLAGFAIALLGLYLNGLGLWSGLILGGLLAGTRLRAFGNILHETVHLSYFKKKKHNLILGYFISVILLEDFDKYRSDHASHHRFLGVVNKDRDLKPRMGLGLHPDFPTQKTLFFKSFLKVYGKATLWAKREPTFFRFFRILYVLALVLILVLFPWETLICMGFSWFGVTNALRFWSDWWDHAGLANEKEELFRSRNHFLKWRWLENLLFPRNDVYHRLHHLFPSLPTRHFPLVHRVLTKEEPDYCK
jgi:fatty acid desaturase